MKFFYLFVFAVISVDGAYEGDLCDANGVNGVCRNHRRCPTAAEDQRKGKPRPPICGFDNQDVIVCCRIDTATTTRRPALTTTRRSSVTTTTEYMPVENDYEYVGNKQGGCDPIPPNMTAKPTGRKAWDKCIEYQEKYVFPCEKGVALTGNLERVNRCHHNADELILGGIAAAQHEFPHMVLLGYIDDQNKIEWESGGALISEKFVLTAGHCTSNRLQNEVSHALIGILKRSQETASNRYGIKRIIKHDKYHSPVKYHDIALLELDRIVPLSHTVVPACLHTGDNVDERRASATGWGATVYNSQNSNADTLQKVVLTKFPDTECSSKYESNRNLLQGIDGSTQVCYGDRTLPKDACQACTLTGGKVGVCCTDCGLVTNSSDAYLDKGGIGFLWKTGQKSWDKCLEYAQKYKYSGCPYVSTAHREQSEDQCHIYFHGAVGAVGGTDVYRGEYPHMALLGYDGTTTPLQWLCSGSLISERFILTAGHCLISRDLGPVTEAAFGLLKRSDPAENWNKYKIKRAIPHPQYKPPIKYHDIALLETEIPVVFIDYLILPACLPAHEEKIHYDRHVGIQYGVTATGWGNLGYMRELADTMQKVQVQKFTDERCSELYPGHRHQPEGLNVTTQMCYGSVNMVRDTCRGDSGGPLQMDTHDPTCMHTLIGVTSFGRECGFKGGAGVYTTVAKYLPWIESVVWP